MPNPRRFYRTATFDHGEMLSRPRYDFVAAAVFTLFIGGLVGSGMGYGPKTHAIVIELPLPDYGIETIYEAEPVNWVTISSRDDILWNDEPVSYNELVAALQQTLREEVSPVLMFEPDANASYDMAARVLNIIMASGAGDKFCFGGLWKHQHYEMHTQPMYMIEPHIPIEQSRCDAAYATRYSGPLPDPFEPAGF